jgi:hypothetical protein
MDIEVRKILADQPIEWYGDLMDDCSARWASLLLRAEWMDDNIWWWAVYDMSKDEVQIDASNNYEIRFTSGAEARRAAEQAAKMYVGVN